MNNPKFAKKYAWLAAITTGMCLSPIQCINDVFASLAATFF